MASTVLKAPLAYLASAAAGNYCLKSPNFSHVSFLPCRLPLLRCRVQCSSYGSGGINWSYSHKKFVSFAANEENVGVQIETQEEDPARGSDSGSELEMEENKDGAIAVDAPSIPDDIIAKEPNSVVIASLNMYREALTNNDESKCAEIESFLKSIEDEKVDMERKVLTLSEELSVEKDRILRVSADFDNFRKRTERERLSLVKNAQGEVVENLLSVLDNFERAKAQIKVETEGEEKIVNSYQSIYKQFTEILASLGVVPVETVGKPFDPMLHEAIMREDSTEYEEDVIIEEYRKGFQLGERLLRPAMVKVSSAPGPAKLETGVSSEDQKEVHENSAEGSAEAAVPEEQA